MNIAIVILSAGSSTRMGTAKQLLQVGNTTLLGLSIEHALKSNASKVICVIGAHAEIIKNSISKYDIDVITNHNFEEGLSSSIVKGVHHIENNSFDAILIMLSDQLKLQLQNISQILAYPLFFQRDISNNF